MLRSAVTVHLTRTCNKKQVKIPIIRTHDTKVERIPTKIFVSGKYNDKRLIRKKLNKLRSQGHEITYDWTSKPETKNKNDLTKEAVLEVLAIKASDVHVLILDDKNYSYRGTFAELGCSVGLGKNIMVYHKLGKSSFMNSPFYNHPLVHHFTSWKKLLRAIDVGNKI